MQILQKLTLAINVFYKKFVLKNNKTHKSILVRRCEKIEILI